MDFSLCVGSLAPYLPIQQGEGWGQGTGDCQCLVAFSRGDPNLIPVVSLRYLHHGAEFRVSRPYQVVVCSQPSELTFRRQDPKMSQINSIIPSFFLVSIPKSLGKTFILRYLSIQASLLSPLSQRHRGFHSEANPLTSQTFFLFRFGWSTPTRGHPHCPELSRIFLCSQYDDS